jgi:L-rhamnose mutarotase
MPDSHTLAFKMQLKPGQVDEYKKRHDELWPELAELLHSAGIHDYSIYLEDGTLSLIAVLKRRSGPEFQARFEALPSHPLMRRWWAHMAALMEVDPDMQPRQWPLRPLFHLA